MAEKMTDTELKALLEGRITNAIGQGTGDKVTGDREEAEKYYKGEPFGDEQDGRSQVVSRDVAEAIDSRIPSLMEIFTSGDDIATFNAVGEADEEAARQETDGVNWVWEQNGGFLVTHTWIKDAEMKRLGTVKIWWQDDVSYSRETYEGLTDAQFHALLEDEDLELKEHDTYADPAGASPMAGGEAVDAPGAGFAPAARALPPPQSSPMYQNDTSAGPLAASSGAQSPGRMGTPMVAGSPSGTPPVPQSSPLPPAVQPLQGEILPPAMLHDCVFRRRHDESRIRIVPVPPDCVLIDRRAGAAERPFGDRCRETVSEVIADYPEHKAELLALASDEEVDWSSEETERFSDEGTSTRGRDDGTVDPLSRYLWKTELYIRVDRDGDDYAELRRFCVVGPSPGQVSLVLAEEEVDDDPYACLTPKPMPHKLVGQSTTDDVKDIQRTKSVLVRKAMDSVYNAVECELVVQGQVDMDAALKRRPGNVIRVGQGGTVTPIESPALIEPTMQAVQYWDSVRDQRVGTARFAAGPGADSLASVFTQATATGADLVDTASKQRILYTARCYAEMGFKRAFLLIHSLLRKHQTKALPMKLRGAWRQVNPADWRERTDMTVEIGPGAVNKAQQGAFLTMIAAKQEQIIATVGPNNPLCGPQELYHTYSALARLAGFRNVGSFFKDPSQQPQQQPAPPPPDPAILTIQATKEIEGERIASNERIKTAELQQKRYETDEGNAIKWAEIGVKHRGLDHQAAAHQDGMLLKHRGEDRADATAVVGAAQKERDFGASREDAAHAREQAAQESVSE